MKNLMTVDDLIFDDLFGQEGTQSLGTAGVSVWRKVVFPGKGGDLAALYWRGG